MGLPFRRSGGSVHVAPVQSVAPAEQAAPAPQTVVPAVSEQTAPQGESAAPAEDARTGVSPSAGVTEVDGKTDVAKKDVPTADKVAGDKNEIAAEATDKADGVEPAAETAAEVAPAPEITETAAPAPGDPKEVLGKFKTLLPSDHESSKGLPVVFKMPDGKVMPKSAMSVIEAKGYRVAMIQKAALPQEVAYNERASKFTIARDAASKLPQHTVGGSTDMMLAVEFNSPVDGHDVNGKLYIEIDVTDKLPNRPPVINGAKNITINRGIKFDPMKNGVSATDPDTGDFANLEAGGYRLGRCARQL